MKQSGRVKKTALPKINACKKAIDTYINSVLNNEVESNKDVKALCRLVKRAFNKEKLKTDDEMFENYMKIGKAMYKTIFPWQSFLLATLLCTFNQYGFPRWNKALIMIGRGAGKDGFIAWISLCMISRNNPIEKYDVDICANNEEQAMRPLNDALEFLSEPTYYNRNKASYRWTKTKITGRKNKGYIKGHTNSPKGKDGLRSGCVILNEIHQYESFANIDVFTTGLGKKEHPRSLYFTTNGNVRDGVLDHYLGVAEGVLHGDVSDEGFFPFLCRLDSKEEVHDEKNWEKANPSLPYLPSLLKETRDEYLLWKENPMTLPAFMTKRMNLPDTVEATDVVHYDYIKATNRPLGDLYGKKCIVGIDTSSTADFTSVSAVFKVGAEYHVINHTWVFAGSKDYNKVKILSQLPDMTSKGYVTVVDSGVEIPPSLIADFIQNLKRNYVVTKVCIDDFKYAIYSRELMNLGFSKENKNLSMVRPNHISKIIPVIERIFLNKLFVWDDNKMLRWATQNTKVDIRKSNTVQDSDIGNKIYAKKEARSRKTDPFMSLVHAMTSESELNETKLVKSSLLRVRSF